MRYAICLSGMMRAFSGWLPHEKIHNNLKNAFSGLDHDFFVSTWDIAGIQRGKKQNICPWSEKKLDTNIVSQIFGDKLKSIQILPFDPPKHTPAWLLPSSPDEMHTGQRLSCMYFQIHEANRLKTHYSKDANISYEATVRCRLDLGFNKPIWEQIQACEIKPDVVYVPEIQSYGYINDQVMWGETSTMNKVAELYHHISHQSNLIAYGSANQPLDPAEKILQSYLHNLGIKIIQIREIYYERYT